MQKSQDMQIYSLITEVRKLEDVLRKTRSETSETAEGTSSESANKTPQLEPPYPYALMQLGNRWSANSKIQCEAQLLDEGFTFDKNET